MGDWTIGTLRRKNYLFFGAEAGGIRSAILYSIVETCQRLEINPQET
ncbi:hypothetical protein OAH36_03530 [Verrucomicrobia bacterium]|nr:hypothetical protein [Verrucomicrobiota bacterium]